MILRHRLFFESNQPKTKVPKRPKLKQFLKEKEKLNQLKNEGPLGTLFKLTTLDEESALYLAKFLDNRYGIGFARLFITENNGSKKVLLRSFMSQPNEGSTSGKHVECLLCDFVRKDLIPNELNGDGKLNEIQLILNKSPCGNCSKTIIKDLKPNEEDADSSSSTSPLKRVKITIQAQYLFHWQDEGNKAGIRNLLKNEIQVEAASPSDVYHWLFDKMKETSGGRHIFTDILLENPDDSDKTSQEIYEHLIDVSKKCKAAELAQASKDTNEAIRKEIKRESNDTNLLPIPADFEEILHRKDESSKQLTQSTEKKMDEIIQIAQADTRLVLQNLQMYFLSLKEKQQRTNIIEQGYEKKKYLEKLVKETLEDMKWLKSKQIKDLNEENQKQLQRHREWVHMEMKKNSKRKQESTSEAVKDNLKRRVIFSCNEHKVSCEETERSLSGRAGRLKKALKKALKDSRKLSNISCSQYSVFLCIFFVVFMMFLLVSLLILCFHCASFLM